MSELSSFAKPPHIRPENLSRLLKEAQSRELLLRKMIERFQKQYGVPLEMLEARLNRGEGNEHPDWEDSIAWRNSAEMLQNSELTQKLVEWLLH
jgi:hypothetical protein